MANGKPMTNGEFENFRKILNAAYTEAAYRDTKGNEGRMREEFERVLTFVYMTARKMNLSTLDDLSGIEGEMVGTSFGSDVQLVAPDNIDDSRYVVRTPSGKYASWLKHSIHAPESSMQKYLKFEYGDGCEGW